MKRLMEIFQVQIIPQLLKKQMFYVLSIPYKNIDSICSELLPQINDNCVVISPIVPMTKTDTGFECVAIKENKPFSHQTV